MGNYIYPTSLIIQFNTEKELDGETGLTYFGARYLDAEVGIWTSPDPLGQFHNSYSFVGGNPVNFIDPWGLEAASSGGTWVPNPDPNATWPTNPDYVWQPSPTPPPSSNVILVTTRMNFDVDRSTGSVPVPPGLGPMDLAVKGLDKAQEVLDKFDFQKAAPKVFQKAEAGGFRGENGKVNYAQVSKATLILTLGVLLDGEGKIAKGSLPSSRALAKALEAAGHVRTPGIAAHHIVAGAAQKAAGARAVLKRFGIGINEASNGVHLCSVKARPRPFFGNPQVTDFSRVTARRGRRPALPARLKKPLARNEKATHVSY